MSELAEDRARVARDLAAMIVRCDEHTDAGGTSFTGETRFAPSLVGPPGRLHGGLHAYARVFPILDALPAHRGVATYPCHLRQGLYRPLPLEEIVPFRGTYSRTDEDYTLEVDHAPAGKLHTIATRARASSPDLAWFRDALARTGDERCEKEIKAQGDVPIRMFRDLAVMPLDRAMRTGGAPSCARFMREDGGVGVSAMCVGLDLLAAVTQGYAWNSHIFTTRIDLVVEAASAEPEVELVMLADRASEPDAECHVRPVAMRDGSEQGPAKVRVMLADVGVTRAYAHGTFTLVPVKRS